MKLFNNSKAKAAIAVLLVLAITVLAGCGTGANNAKTNANAYQVVSTDESGDIIVKLVNVSGVAQSFAVDVAGAEHIGDTAKVYQVAGNSLEDDNIFGQPEACTLNEFTVSGFSNQFNYTVPKYSVTIIRIPTGE